MYTLEQLLEDVARNRGPLTKKGGDYRQVWDVFNRYLTALMEKQQTLSVMNFCKIGWKIEGGSIQGRAKLRPHFQVTDSFAQAFNVDMRTQTIVPDKYLATVEEFNFSKAAIRFSQNLTKDNVFMGMRAIVQQLGVVVSSGQPMSVDFEVGKLVSSERALSFAFVADLYLQAGLEVPPDVAQDTGYRPTATYAPPSQDALTLSLTGTKDFSGSIRATNMGGWEDTGPSAATIRDPPSLAEHSAVDGREAAGYSNAVESNLSKHEHVQQLALGRHLAQITEDAEEAIDTRDRWEDHLQRCVEEEQKDAEWRRVLCKDHAVHLEYQMRQTADRRSEGRHQQIEQASMHDFPSFAETPETAIYSYIRERRDHLKQDLDQQVDVKKRLKHSAKQRERDLEISHLQANNEDIARMRLEASGKQGRERAALVQAWDTDKHLKAVRKAVDSHHKAPTTKADLSDIMNSLQPNQGLGPSPRHDGLSTPSSRSVTGSVRRMPIGAAASLALNRDRILTTPRR
mmetsp:Transcript_23196/g.64829  ORF Transcript_23196/g.64829 Transcript_23196/m.64829 type:complete len:513 (+) Transcript_23196:88-1626(+)